MSFIPVLLLAAIICLIIGIVRTAIMRSKNKETVVMLVDELEEITDELRRIKNGNKTVSVEHKEALIRREHDIVRTLKIKYPKSTKHQYEHYQYKYDD